MDFSQYTNKNIKEIFEELESSENGLSESEAKKRQKIYGLNEIKAKEVGIFDILIRQFKSPFFYLLFIAAITCFLIRQFVDGFIIFAFVFINVSLGFLQETRAQRAIYLLKKYIPSKTKILRSGSVKIIDKRFLVPGDIVVLETGDMVPADLRIIKAENFLVDESVLSGESMPLTKTSAPLSQKTQEIFEASNVAFAGTLIVSGRAEGVAVSTGKETVIGRITKLVSGIKRESDYEKDLFKLSKIVLRTVVITITFIFLANLAIKGTASFSEMLVFSLALIVSIIPEALPVVITFAFSEGALKLAKEKVVVKRLSAVEDLGNIEILCTDKTGTLTKNKLELKDIFAKDKEKILLYSLLVSNWSESIIQDNLNPFDSALYKKAPDNVRQSLRKFKKILEFPFDPHRLRSSALLENEEGKLILITKGAPEVILKLSSKFEYGLGNLELEKKIKQRGMEGKRILAVAFKEYGKRDFSENDEKNMIFLGYFAFEDPLKETAKEAINLARRLGVAIKMITGDSKEVAGHVAKEFALVNSSKEVILGETLNSLSEEDFEESCHRFSVFARVSPETKLKIIKSLQKKYTVGFLGEGINDTPALKIANVGIVVQEAADVPRETADIILLEKDLKVIVNGIKNGRNIFSNINKYIKCALASNFGNFYSIAVISLFVNFLPMLPVQILLGNLLSDFPLIAITTDSVDPEELRKPKSYQFSYFIRLIICLALVSTVFDFLFFGIFYGILYRNQPAILQTLWFIESILTEVTLIFAIRTQHSFLKTKRPSLTLITLAIIDSLFIVLLPFSSWGQRFFHFAHPPISAVLIVFSLVFSYFITSEIVKLIYFHVKPPPNSSIKSRQQI